jgi:hypothetical protein
VDPLHADYRTAAIGGERAARRQLATIADRLRMELQPGETATWVAVSATLPPVLAVLTNRRLLAMPIIPGRPVQAATVPFAVRLGKKRILGQAVDVVGAQGVTVSLVLAPGDLDQVRRAGDVPAAASDATPPASVRADSSRPVAPPPPGSVGAWHWGRPVVTWQDAELMAAAHLTHLGFPGAVVTPGTGDGGLDAVADGAAAQVKHHTAPSGSPDIQRLFGAAADFPNRLFYATAYTPAGVAEAERLEIALFQFTPEGLVVAVNAFARQVAPSAVAPEQRGFFGNLTFESRQNRAVRWAEEIQDATQVPISNRQRKGARQLAARQQALQLMVRGLEQLQDSDNPLYQQRRRQRTLAEAEKTLKEAGRLLGLLLH